MSAVPQVWFPERARGGAPDLRAERPARRDDQTPTGRQHQPGGQVKRHRQRGHQRRRDEPLVFFLLLDVIRAVGIDHRVAEGVLREHERRGEDRTAGREIIVQVPIDVFELVDLAVEFGRAVVQGRVARQVVGVEGKAAPGEKVLGEQQRVARIPDGGDRRRPQDRQGDGVQRGGDEEIASVEPCCACRREEMHGDVGKWGLGVSERAAGSYHPKRRKAGCGMWDVGCGMWGTLETLPSGAPKARPHKSLGQRPRIECRERRAL